MRRWFHIYMLALTWLSLILSSSNAIANQNNTSSAKSVFCSTMVKIESVLSDSIPLVVLPPKTAKQIAERQLDALEPMLVKAKAHAALDIVDAVETYSASIIKKLTYLDFEVMHSKKFIAADNIIDTKLLAECGFEEISITAVNYEYLGIPEVQIAGATALTLTNKGDEVHEISIARINDGVNLSPKEIISLPEDKSLALIKLVAYAEVAPGQSETTFMHLDDGRYYAVCFTPEGTMSLKAIGEGAPHLFHGMLKEFAVGTGSAPVKQGTPFNASDRSTPKELLTLLGQYIDAGDLDAILSIHEAKAGIVEWSGNVAKNKQDIRKVYKDFFATNPDLNVNARQIIEIDDIAIILGDYTLDFTYNSKLIKTHGKFGDIVRRQPDGKWLYLLDNPYAP